LSPSGSLIGSFGAYGSGDGQFKQPWDVVVSSSGSVFVIDRSNARVQKFAYVP